VDNDIFVFSISHLDTGKPWGLGDDAVAMKRQQLSSGAKDCGQVARCSKVVPSVVA